MKQELKDLITVYGMQKLLEAFIERMNEDAIAFGNEPYIVQLRDNLQKTYDDYMKRYNDT